MRIFSARRIQCGIPGALKAARHVSGAVRRTYQACLHGSLAARDAETEGVEAEDVSSALAADGGRVITDN